ncbi:MAG: ATP-binding cassette domain-containing protein [Marinilabiliales bacterium]|nr:ATP-binding cassette domain-containing protein [Marinilabiliales bacterium]
MQVVLYRVGYGTPQCPSRCRWPPSSSASSCCSSCRPPALDVAELLIKRNRRWRPRRRPAVVTSEMEMAGGVDRSTRAGVALQLVELHRSAGPTRALDGLSLDIAAGELVALLGPSGCGKATALRIIAGLDEADSGEVLVEGEDISGVRAKPAGMGMVHQAYSLFPNMTARDNVAYGLLMRKVGKAERRRRANDPLELVGPAARAGRYPQ